MGTKLDREKKLYNAIEGYKAGNKEKFNDIYELSNKYIYTCISKSINDVDAIQDIMQETYIAISNNLNKLESVEAFRVWSGKIATNKAFKYYKKNKEILLDADNQYIFNEIEEDNEHFLPGNIMDNKEAQKLVREIINALPLIQKNTIMNYYFNEMKVEEIAKEFEIPVGTVKTNLYQSRKKIKVGIEGLEKKNGIKLYSLSPAPILLFLFMQEVEEAIVPKAISKAVITAVSEELGVKVLGGNIIGSSIIKGSAKILLSNVAKFGIAKIIVIFLVVGTITTGALVVNNQMNKTEDNVVAASKEAISDSEVNDYESVDEKDILKTEDIKTEDLKPVTAGYELPEEPNPAVVENTNTNTNTGTGNTNTGTATTTPPAVTSPVVTPPVVTPPVVTPPVVNGITPEELANRATGMGWNDIGISRGIHCFEYKEGNYLMGLFATENKQVQFGLERSSSTFDSSVHQMINLVLPTGGDKLFNIITAPFDNQTLSLDGKSVQIKQDDRGVEVNIYWP